MEFLSRFETAAVSLERPREHSCVLSSYRSTRSSLTFGESRAKLVWRAPLDPLLRDINGVTPKLGFSAIGAFSAALIVPPLRFDSLPGGIGPDAVLRSRSGFSRHISGGSIVMERRRASLEPVESRAACSAPVIALLPP
jgi:hypothetical protein